MYAKLSIRNAKRSIKDYIIYFVTLTLCVSLFYAFMSLSSSKYELVTGAQYNLTTLYTYIKYASYFITAVLTLLVNHVNKYMMNRRKREFATYILLGVEQIRVAFMFFVESLIMGVLSIVMGIILGALFSQVLTALILTSVNRNIVFSFRLYSDTIFKTIIFFSIIYTAIGLLNIKSLSKIKLIDMFNSDKKTEIQLSKGKWFYIFIAVVSVICYIIAFYNIPKYVEVSQISSFYIDVNVKNRILLKIILGMILGTYGLFYSSAYILILMKNKFINFKYKNTNLFLLGQLLSKMNTSSILMATVTLTLFMSILCFVLSPIMSEWVMGYLGYRSVADVQIYSRYNDIYELEDVPLIDYREVIHYLSENEYGIEDYCQFELYFLKEEDFYKRKKEEFPVLAVSLSDYNKFRNMVGYESITLKDHEFAMHWDQTIPRDEIERYMNKNLAIEVNGETFSTELSSYYLETLGGTVYNQYTDFTIILPDYVSKDLLVANVNFYLNTDSAMSYDFAVTITPFVEGWFKDTYEYLYDKYGDVIESRKPIAVRTKTEQVNEAVTGSLMIKVLGIYAGTILLIICLTILALQQLSDSFEHKKRFEILQKIGVNKGHISKLILKQISIYFGVPAIAALLGIGVFLYYFSNQYYNELRLYVGSQVFMLNVAISITVIILLYANYFVAAYYGFKRNINH